jgi:hypothetical protein
MAIADDSALVPYSRRTAAASTARDLLGRGLMFPRGDLLAGALTGGGALALGGQVLSDVNQGRSLDATVTAGVGAGVLGLGEIAARTLGRGKGGLIARGVSAIAAPVLGNLAGNAAESKRAEDTGVAPAGASEVEERKASRAQRNQNAQDLLTQQVNTMNANLAGIKDMMAAAGDQQITNMQRQMPLIQKSLDNALVRQQALNASNASNYAMLGTVATAGKLATGAQAEAGATMRTMLSNNPYAGSVMQAPNISFG